MQHRSFSRSFAFAALVSCALTACAPDPTGSPRRLAISVLPQTATLIQGDSIDVTAVVTANFTLSPVTQWAITGAPAGVTSRVVSEDQGVSAVTAVLRIAAAPSAAPGTFTLRLSVTNAARESPVLTLPITVEPLPACTQIDPCIQWAQRATASSEYTIGDWSARQATGAPNVPSCADHVNAWASLTLDQPEWLEVEYRDSMIPVEIRIYESYGASAITSVEVKDDQGVYYRVYSGTPTKLSCPHVRIIPVSAVAVKVKAIRVNMNQKPLNDWNEIDAVSLEGYRPNPWPS